MKLVVGLGNIGKEYALTRHNIGFMAVDAILSNLGISLGSEAMNGNYAVCTINDQKVMFVEPTTLMNLSGNCVGQIAKFYKIQPNDILVIHDDLDLLPGNFKIRTGGSAGGHNGIKDIINKLGKEDFIRFKIGIGHPQYGTVVDHVLGKFKKDELELVKKPITKCVEFVKLWLSMPTNQAISKINQQGK